MFPRIKVGDLVVRRVRIPNCDSHGIVLSVDHIKLFNGEYLCEVLFRGTMRPDRTLNSALKKLNPA